MRIRLVTSIGTAAVVAASLLLMGTPATAGAETAVPGSVARTPAPAIAPSDAADFGTYLDQDGKVLPRSAGSAPATTDGTCTPGSGRDNPHYTAPDVSGHGWWTRGNCTGSTATVYNCLYEYYDDGTWRQKACSPKAKTLKPGGGSAQRTNSRVTCNSTGEAISWRNHVDVDVNGESDTGEQPYNQATVNCVVG